MEIESEKEDKSLNVTEIGDKVEVHLNSVVGISNPKTMKLEGRIGEQRTQHSFYDYPVKGNVKLYQKITLLIH